MALAIKSRRKRLRALRRLGDDDPQKIVALKQFQEAQSHCRKAIHEAKQSSWDAFVESINPDTPASQVWNKINKLQGKRQRNTISLNLETGHTNNGPTVANALADEYQQKSSDANYPERFRKKHKKDKRTRCVTQRPNLHKRYNTDLTVEELMWALDRRVGSSTGPDNVSYQLLQRLPFSGKTALLELFNRIWASGCFPAQ